MTVHEPPADDIAALEQAIAHMESQRSVLGDAVANAAIATIREKLASLRSKGALEERRQVTVLFADLVGFTAIAESMDPEEVAEAQAGFFSACRRVIEHHGGVVEKFIGDAVVAVFGVPSSTETDPTKAVLTALDLQAAVRDLNTQWGWSGAGATSSRHAVTPTVRLPSPLRLRVGVNTGLVVIAFPAGPGGEFAVSGDTVNTASRIQGAAPAGGVLIAHATYRHVHGMFDMRAMEPITVKGKSEPLLTYLVIGVRSPAARNSVGGLQGIETTMVGRDNELDTLRRAYGETMARRRAQSMLVIGEAGIGKSRLLYEFERWRGQQAPPVTCLRGRASPELTTTPYGLLRDVLRSHFGITESDSVADVRDKFEHHTAAYLAAEQAHVSGHLLGFDFSSTPGVRSLADSPTFAQTALTHVWTYFSDLSRDTPLVFLLEDLHWADPPSLEFLTRMARDLRDRRLLLIGTTRPALFERVPGWQDEQSSGFVHVTLSPLTPSQSQTLVADILLHVDELPHSLCERIVEHADGNPFYLEETINMLIDDGIIVRGPKRWLVQTERLERLRVPTTLTGVLQARFDGLSPDERVVLQRAAVVGRYFWDGSIIAMPESGDGRIDVAGCLREAQRKNLVFPHGPSRFHGSNEYLFKHAVLREVVYETVLLRSRRIYHQAVGQWLERQTGERTREFAALIADHYEKGGDAASAADWLMKAAEAAIQSADFRRAVADGERALALLAQGGVAMDTRHRQVALRVVLGEAYMRLSEFPEARRHLEEALDSEDTDQELAVRTFGLLSRITTSCGDVSEARRLGERGLALARGLADPSVTRVALLALGYTLFFCGDYPAVAGCAEECLELAREDQDQYHMSRAFTLLGNAALNLADYEASARCYQEGIRLADAAGAPFESSTCLGNLGNVYMAQGDNIAALRCYEAAYEFSRKVGDRWGAAIDMANIGQAHEHLGNRETALNYYEQSLSNALEVNATWVALSALAGKAGILLSDGDAVRAAEFLGLALRHPLSNAEVAHDAADTLAKLRQQLPPDVLEQAMERGAHLDIHHAT